MATIVAYLSVAPILLVLAVIFYRNPPKQRNNVYGYRTKQSMRNEESWRFANELSTRLFLRFAVVLNVIQLALFLLVDLKTALIVTLILTLGGIGLMFYQVETKLKEKGF